MNLYMNRIVHESQNSEFNVMYASTKRAHKILGVEKFGYFSRYCEPIVEYVKRRTIITAYLGLYDFFLFERGG